MSENLRFKSAIEIEGPATEGQIKLYESAVDRALRYREALEQIKERIELLNAGSNTKGRIYRIACKALEES